PQEPDAAVPAAAHAACGRQEEGPAEGRGAAGGQEAVQGGGEAGGQEGGPYGQGQGAEEEGERAAGGQEAVQEARRQAQEVGEEAITFARSSASRSSSVNPSSSESAARVCSPSLGAAVRTAPGVSERRTGTPVTRVSPAVGCFTGTTMSRA